MWPDAPPSESNVARRSAVGIPQPMWLDAPPSVFLLPHARLSGMSQSFEGGLEA
ncbi:MAG: hypothetical protein IT422_21670 [Pirellulaceae bacterium]|nr:hypothetical protein [Pirellulaceae bacterium]